MVLLKSRRQEKKRTDVAESLAQDRLDGYHLRGQAEYRLKPSVSQGPAEDDLIQRQTLDLDLVVMPTPLATGFASCASPFSTKRTTFRSRRSGSSYVSEMVASKGRNPSLLRRRCTTCTVRPQDPRAARSGTGSLANKPNPLVSPCVVHSKSASLPLQVVGASASNATGCDWWRRLDLNQ